MNRFKQCTRAEYDAFVALLDMTDTERDVFMQAEPPMEYYWSFHERKLGMICGQSPDPLNYKVAYRILDPEQESCHILSDPRFYPQSLKDALATPPHP